MILHSVVKLNRPVGIEVNSKLNIIIDTLLHIGNIPIYNSHRVGRMVNHLVGKICHGEIGAKRNDAFSDPEYQVPIHHVGILIKFILKMNGSVPVNKQMIILFSKIGKEEREINSGKLPRPAILQDHLSLRITDDPGKTLFGVILHQIPIVGGYPARSLKLKTKIITLPGRQNTILLNA